jgi:hypothetical protein
MHHSHLAEEVTFQRAALLLGLRSPEDVHSWAEAVVSADPVPPLALIDTVLAPPELTALRAALAPIALEQEPPVVVRRLLALTAEDLRSGRRSVADTMHVLTQLRRLVAVPRDLARVLDNVAGDYMLAAAGVRGHVAAEEARVAAWLADYAP